MTPRPFEHYDVIDLSIAFSETMPKYDAAWFPHFRVRELRPESMPEASWKRRFTALDLFVHNGTHIEVSDHVFRDGNTVDGLPLTRFIGHPVIVDLLDVPDRSEISAETIAPFLSGKAIGCDTIVLVRTGYDDRNWGKVGFWQNSPWLSPDAAQLLSDTGAGFFGLDFQTEKPGEREFVVHRTLLSKKHAVLCEYLFCLGKATPESIFMAFPVKIRDVEAAPVRAVLLVPNRE
jgi:kynurenine formamidase